MNIPKFCHPEYGEHIWLTTLPDESVSPDLLCACCTITWKNRNHPENELNIKPHWDYDRYDETPENGMIT